MKPLPPRTPLARPRPRPLPLIKSTPRPLPLPRTPLPLKTLPPGAPLTAFLDSFFSDALDDFFSDALADLSLEGTFLVGVGALGGKDGP